jgi:hypothetical protein
MVGWRILAAALIMHKTFGNLGAQARILGVKKSDVRTRRGWQPPLAALFSIFYQSFNLNPTINACPR